MNDRVDPMSQIGTASRRRFVMFASAASFGIGALVAGTTFVLSATTSQAQQPEVARNTCSECHATQKGQLLSPNLRAPTFVEIADTPGVTAAALLLMLTTPHAGMPMFILSPEQRQQIIDYVLSLKTTA
jgi:mono/diheme cytochrome c family protein